MKPLILVGMAFLIFWVSTYSKENPEATDNHQLTSINWQLTTGN